eukprot:scaffold2727_cov140-Isochrysis_galbana.AAC.5
MGRLGLMQRKKSRLAAQNVESGDREAVHADGFAMISCLWTHWRGSDAVPELHAALCGILIRHHPPADRHQRQLARRSPARRCDALHRRAYRRPRRQPPQRAATIRQQQADPTTDSVDAR